MHTLIGHVFCMPKGYKLHANQLVLFSCFLNATWSVRLAAYGSPRYHELTPEFRSYLSAVIAYKDTQLTLDSHISERDMVSFNDV